MNKHYFEMAEKNTPPLFYRTVGSDKTVCIEEDPSSFFGYVAHDEGKIPEVLVAGDCFTVDFGEHCVGKISFSLSDTGRYLDAPVRLRLRMSETPYELGRNHEGYHGRLCSSWLYEEVINLDNIGRIELPRRYSFRYLEISVVASPRPLRLFDFSVLTQTSADVGRLAPLPEGTDPLLVEIDRVAAATLRDCMQSAYEDGPKRDRRLWSGDLRLQALTDQVLFGNDTLARRCLYLFASCCEEDRYLPGCLYQYPTLSFDRGMEILDYSMLWCTSVADYYAHTKDLETVKDLFPVIEHQVKLVIQSMDECGIVTTPKEGWHGFIDWAEGLEPITSLQGVFLYALNHLLPLCSALGKDTLFQRWSAVQAHALEASQAYLYNKERRTFVNDYDKDVWSVQSQVWAILGGMIEGEAAKELLCTSLASPDTIKPVTPYMHHYLVEAMLKVGMKDEALAHIKSYWGAMVKEGADTFWEVFVKDDPTVSPYDDPLIHSFCHAWSCSPSYFIRTYFV